MLIEKYKNHAGLLFAYLGISAKIQVNLEQISTVLESNSVQNVPIFQDVDCARKLGDLPGIKNVAQFGWMH